MCYFGISMGLKTWPCLSRYYSLVVSPETKKSVSKGMTSSENLRGLREDISINLFTNETSRIPLFMVYVTEVLNFCPMTKASFILILRRLFHMQACTIMPSFHQSEHEENIQDGNPIFCNFISKKSCHECCSQTAQSNDNTRAELQLKKKI